MSNNWPLMHHVYFLTVIKFAWGIPGSSLKRVHRRQSLISRQLFMVARAREAILPMLQLLQHLLPTLEMNMVRLKAHMRPLRQSQVHRLLTEHLLTGQMVMAYHRQEQRLTRLHRLCPYRNAAVADSGLPWEPFLECF